MNENKKTEQRELPPIIDRCLSVLDPFAYAVVTFKSIENRTWATPFRGRIAIHTSLSLAALENQANESFLLDAHPRITAAFDDERIDDEHPLFQLGCIVGSVEVVDCVPFDPATQDPDEIFANYVNSHLAPEIPHGMWADGPVCWVLASPRRYRVPIKTKGRLNLWQLTPELAAAVAAAETDLLTDPGEPAATPLVLKRSEVEPSDASTEPTRTSKFSRRRKRDALVGQALPVAGKRRK